MAELRASGVPISVVEHCWAANEKKGSEYALPPPPPQLRAVFAKGPTTQLEKQRYNASVNMSRSSVDYTTLPYPPLQALRVKAGRRGACLRRSDAPGMLFKEYPGARMYTNPAGFDVLELPKGTHVFKGTRYFYRTLGEHMFMWVGNAPTAISYATRYSGGCMVYQTTRPIKLFVMTGANWSRVHAETKWKPAAESDQPPPGFVVYDEATFDPLSNITKRALELKTGAGISLAEQAMRVRAHNIAAPDEVLQIFRTRGIDRFTYCERPEPSRIFGAGANDRHVAALLFALRDKVGGVDGWFSPETYTPFHCKLTEEVLVFPSLGNIAIDTAHPLWWERWVRHLPGLTLPREPFDLHPNYYLFNHDAIVVTTYAKHQDSALTRAVLSSARSNPSRRNNDGSLRLLSWNVYAFESPDATVTTEAACDRCVALVRSRDADVVSLQAVPSELLDRLTRGMAAAGYVARGITPNGNESFLACFAKEGAVSGFHVVDHTDQSVTEGEDEVPRNALAVELAKIGKAEIILVNLTPEVSSFHDVPLPLFVHMARTKTAERMVHLRDAIGARPNAKAIVGCFGAGGDSDEIRALVAAGASAVDLGGTTTLQGRTDDHCVLLPRRRHSAGGSVIAVGARVLPFVQSMHLPIEMDLRLSRRLSIASKNHRSDRVKKQSRPTTHPLSSQDRT